MKTCLMPYTNNKGADQPARIDQPAHAYSLISTFVVRCLDVIIPALAAGRFHGDKLHPVLFRAKGCLYPGGVNTVSSSAF